MSKDTVIIVNPKSNSGLTGKNWDSIFQTISSFFENNIKVAFTEQEGDGTELARLYLKKGIKNIIPIGGDGTINEVANGFFEDNNYANYNIHTQSKDMNSNFLLSSSLKPINPEATMTILPSGTRNVLIQSLGLPNDFDQCCKKLGNCKTSKRIDIIYALVTNPVDPEKKVSRIFLNAAEIGIGAEIINKSKDIRKRVNSRILSTIAGIATTLPTYKDKICEITIGVNKDSNIDDKIITKMTMGIVANGSFLGGNVQAATKARVDDGLLDIVIIKNSEGISFLNEIINLKNGDQSKSEKEGNIYYTQSKNVSMFSEEEKNIIVTLDGEPIGTLPGLFKVFPNYLKIRI
jgi:diacylglycerol kinase (ATP)